MYTILEQENKNLFQKTLDDLKTQIKFVGTFGFGITGLYETIQELLYGKYPTLSEHEIILIFLAALSYFAIDVVDDVKKLTEVVREKGLGKYLTQTVETLKDFENVAIEVGKRAGHTISSLAELVGYIYLLIPILETVQRLIAKEGFDIVTLGIYLKSILTSIGIFYTKNIFDKLIHRLKRNTPKDDKDVIKEHTERRDELRRVLDKYEKDFKRISPELIIDLAIEDPSTDYDYLDWMVVQVKMGFFLGVDLKYVSKLINKFHLHKDILTKGRLLRIISRFKKLFPGQMWVWNNDEILAQILDNPTDINNYPGYGQVEQILQMIDFSVGSSQAGTIGPNLQLEQLDYLQKKGEQSTRKVVSDILKIIKEPDSDEEFYHLPDYFSGIDGDMYEFGELEFNVYVNIVEYDSLKEPFIVDAEMGGDYDDEIYVTITIGPKFSDRDYEDIQMVLNDYVRHEVEHVIDATEGGDIESPDNLSPYDYYMQPHEVRAQKAGFNRKAKLEKKPVEDIIYDYLEYRQKIDKLSDEEKSNLTKTLSEHEESRINPDLDEGDTIRVIEVDGEHANMPEIWGIYQVHDVKQDNVTQEFYYELSGETSEVVQDSTFSTTRLTNTKYLYYGDTWIPADVPMATKVDRKTISEHKESKISPDLEPGDIIRVIDIKDVERPNKPERFGVYKVRSKGMPPIAISNYPYTETAKVAPWYEIALLDDDVNSFDYVINRIYWGDTWIYANVDRKTISEHKEPGLNPELTYGDTILVVDIDREREDGKTTYTSPGEQMRPERYTPYTVVDKETNGHKSEWPFRYTVVPEKWLEEYEKTLDRGWGNYGGYEKLLYPWIYQWIYANTPTATKVDRKTISEHQKTKVSPELEVDDIIRVIELEADGYKWEGQTKRPETFAVYRVLGKEGFAKYDGSRSRYDLIKLPVSKETRHRIYTIYVGDTWIYADEPTATSLDRETISEHKEKDKRYNQPLEVGDIIELLHMDDPWNPILPLTKGIVMGFESVPGGEDKILVTWIVDPENDKLSNMPMIPEVDVWRKIEKKDGEWKAKDLERYRSGTMRTY